MSVQTALIGLRGLVTAHARRLVVIAGLMLAGVALLGWLAPRQTATGQDVPTPKSEHLTPKNYSPYVDRDHATAVHWGDQHLHTAFSSDAGMLGGAMSTASRWAVI